MFLKLIVSFLTTEAAKQLAVCAASAVAKRTTNTVDDAAVRLIASTLGVTCPVEHLEGK
jgi:hypothetical protein